MRRNGFIPVLILVVIGLIILAIIGLAWGSSYILESFGQKPGQTVDWTGNECSVIFPTGAGTDEEIGEAINKYISTMSPSSPLKDLGLNFATSGRNANIHPALIVAFARKESSFGTRGGRKVTEGHNPFGRKAAQGENYVLGDDGNTRWLKFPDFATAVNEQGPYLKRVYVDQGATDIASIVEKYAPRGENNTDLYIQQMVGFINDVIQESEGALGSMCSSPNIDYQMAGDFSLANFRSWHLEQGNYGGRIAEAGCALTSEAMVINFINGAADTNLPVKIFRKYGIQAQWGSTASDHGLKHSTISPRSSGAIGKIAEDLRKNIPVIVGATSDASGWTSSTHFAVIVGIQGDYFVLNDPNSTVHRDPITGSHPREHFKMLPLLQNQSGAGLHVFSK